MAYTLPEPRGAGAPPGPLPPLILHPFSDQAASSQVLESSRAGLMLSGLVPSEGLSQNELGERVLRARYLEIRMLYFLGKDVTRWMGQCVEWSERGAGPEAGSLREQSFADLLARNTPPAVAAKLRGWGVYDYASIFSRAIGLYTAFAEPAALDHLSRDFLLNYHRYADSLYFCYQQLAPFAEIAPGRFHFELYGSGEYSLLLESQWGAS